VLYSLGLNISKAGVGAFEKGFLSIMLHLLPPVLLEEALCQEMCGLLHKYCVTRGGHVTTHQVQTMRHTWVTSWQERKGWRTD
jgi:hypothetical protein